MEIRQLLYFLEVAEEGQITAAAQSLHISQPPLSHQIKLLEEELGIQLLERGRRNVELTDAGHILKNRAEQILELIDVTKKEIEDLKVGLHGTLNIAAVASSDTTLLLKHIQNFHSKYPNVSYRLSEGETTRVVDLLKSGVAELGMIRTPFDSDSFEVLNLTAETDNDPMVAVEKKMRADHQDELPINPKYPAIPLSFLKKKPLIIHQRYEEKIVDAFKHKKLEAHIFCVSDDIRSMLTWASNGLGTAIVPQSAVNLLEKEAFNIYELQEATLKTGVALIWPKNRYLSTSARHFIKVCQETMTTS